MGEMLHRLDNNKKANIKKNCLKMKEIYSLLSSLSISNRINIDQVTYVFSQNEKGFLNLINSKSFANNLPLVSSYFRGKKNFTKIVEKEIFFNYSIYEELEILYSRIEEEYNNCSTVEFGRLPAITVEDYANSLKPIDLINIVESMIEEHKHLIEFIVKGNPKFVCVEEYIFDNKVEFIESQFHLKRRLKDELVSLVKIIYCIENKIEYNEQLYFQLDIEEKNAKL